MLDLAAFDVAEAQAAARVLATRGIAITTLAAEQVRRPAEWLAEFTHLENVTRAHFGEAARSPAEMVERLAFLKVDPTALFIARLAERYVGYTCLNMLESDGEILTQGWTGVRPEFGRQGLATALKLVGAAYAKAQGYRQIVTAPRLTNLASLRANARVGFRPRDYVQPARSHNVRYATIRRLLQHLEGLAAWRFAAVAIGILGLLRVALGDAALRQNEGAFELFSILRLVAAAGVLFLLVQRRQSDA